MPQEQYTGNLDDMFDSADGGASRTAADEVNIREFPRYVMLHLHPLAGCIQKSIKAPTKLKIMQIHLILYCADLDDNGVVVAPACLNDYE